MCFLFLQKVRAKHIAFAFLDRLGGAVDDELHFARPRVLALEQVIDVLGVVISCYSVVSGPGRSGASVTEVVFVSDHATAHEVLAYELLDLHHKTVAGITVGGDHTPRHVVTLKRGCLVGHPPTIDDSFGVDAIDLNLKAQSLLGWGSDSVGYGVLLPVSVCLT